MLKNIMVVDDDPDIIFILRTLLRKNGFSVTAASSGSECLMKLKEKKSDLILLDIMMPDMSGWEVCKKIKKICSVPVSMLSIRRDKEDIKKSLKYAGADRHLAKPINFNDIMNTVNSLIEPHN